MKGAKACSAADEELLWLLTGFFHRQLSGLGKPDILLPSLAGDPGNKDIRYILFPLSAPRFNAQYFTSARMAGELSYSR